MIFIVIPNYNGEEHLATCLTSLRNQTYQEYRIIVVDNGSSDNSIKLIKESFPEVHIISNSVNKGFANAVNVGINYSINSDLCEFILLLNNDTECDTKFLENFVNGIRESDAGSAACKMLDFYNRKIIDTVGDYLDLKSYPYKRGSGETDTGQYDKKGYIFSACGGAALYKKEVFLKTGLFDDNFFAYYEDIDFSYRMQLYGYKCIYIPEAICYHKCGATIKKKHAKKFFLMERNLTSLVIKNYHAKLILKFGVVSFFVRFWNLLRFLKRTEFTFFFYSLKGLVTGIFTIPKYLPVRKIIQKNSVKTAKDIELIAMDYKNGYKEFNN